MYTPQLFWQYPAVTEKTFWEQNRHHQNYMPVPWATVIDKRYNLQDIYNMVKPRCLKDLEYYTCCQHIHFRTLIPLLKRLGIRKLYTPHKVKNEGSIDGIELVGCPLFAVNFEDPTRNKTFSQAESPPQRDLLYSFVGGYQKGYMSVVRLRIFDLPERSDCLVRNTGSWHFNDIVYSPQQSAKLCEAPDPSHAEKTEHYNRTLLRSRYSLCPSGSGPNSIRLWESLAAGAIPVVLADTLDLPAHPLWDSAVVVLPEHFVSVVFAALSQVPPEKEAQMRRNCLEIYDFFRGNFTGLIN